MDNGVNCIINSLIIYSVFVIIPGLTKGQDISCTGEPELKRLQ